MAQRMQMRVNAEVGSHFRVPVGDGIRVAVPSMVGGVGEQEAVIIERRPELRALSCGELLVGGQNRDGVRIKVNDVHLVSLGVLDDGLAVLADQVAADRQGNSPKAAFYHQIWGGGRRSASLGYLPCRSSAARQSKGERIRHVP